MYNPKCTLPPEIEDLSIVVYDAESTTKVRYHFETKMVYGRGVILGKSIYDFIWWSVCPAEAKPTDDNICMMCGWVGHHEDVVWASVKISSLAEAPHCPKCDTPYQIAGIDKDPDEVPF